MRIRETSRGTRLQLWATWPRPCGDGGVRAGSDPGDGATQGYGVLDQRPQVTSPEVPADRRVTFRLRAPHAHAVSVMREGTGRPLPMQKDDEGVWTATTDPRDAARLRRTRD